MDENHEGFVVPVVNNDKCINCGLCMAACPSLNQTREDNAPDPECYAAQARDEIREVSSSGGVFTLLAEEILARKGYVCGAAFRDDWTVHHMIVDNKEELAKLRGSKYVQSDIGYCYREISKLLKAGKYVLFTGTPCQVAGLYLFLGKKDYETLYTVDIFCHGAPSPGVWKRYLRENYDIASIRKINFRDKSAIGWSCSHVAITLHNGTKDISDDYTKWFHRSAILRPSCRECKYSQIPRPADISLGDFWGINSINADLNDKKGLSNVLINSEKGKHLYNSIRLTKSHPVVLPPSYNNADIRHGQKQFSPEREAFFSQTMPLNTTKLSWDCIQGRRYDVCYVGNFYSKNYGSILVHYAGAKLIESLGLQVLMLNRPDRTYDEVIPYSFAYRHYSAISPSFKGLDELATTNGFCASYVVGSDQIFAPGLNLDQIAYLQFARKDRLKIAFGTSFGHETYPCAAERLHKNKSLLQRFDYIALRERPSNIVHNLLELKADRIIDPTLILPRQCYYDLAEEASEPAEDSPYLLTYMLDLTPEKEDAIVFIAKRLGLKIIYMANLQQKEVRYKPTQFTKEKDYSPEEFLRLYRDASYLVTDSYHGTCFSIIFRKNFISLVNTTRGKLRYQMFDMFGLSHRFYSTPSEVYNSDEWIKPVDYSKAARIIEKKAAYARRKLKRALWKVRLKKHTYWMHENIAYPVRDFFRRLRKRVLFQSRR